MRLMGHGHFDERAAEYEESPHQSTFFDPLHQLTLEEACREMSAPHSLLDIGCGTGRFLRRAAAVFPQAELVGVDSSGEMIRVAQLSVTAQGNSRFLHATAEALPLRDASFDVVISTASFHHWADQSRGLEEVYRVLRPLGVFALTDILAAGMLRVPLVTRLLVRLDGGRFNSPEALDGMLDRAGFDVVRRTRVAHLAGAGSTFVTVGRKRESRSA